MSLKVCKDSGIWIKKLTQVYIETISKILLKE